MLQRKIIRLESEKVPLIKRNFAEINAVSEIYEGAPNKDDDPADYAALVRAVRIG